MYGRYGDMIGSITVADQQHEYLLNVLSSNKVKSYMIDGANGGDKVEDSKVSIPDKVILSSYESLSYYYMKKKDPIYEWGTRKTVSMIGGQLGDSTDDFVIGKQTFNGSTQLPQVTSTFDAGKVCTICKSGDSDIVIQDSDKQCAQPVDWSIAKGFVDADRVVLIDKDMTVRSFPRSALTPVGEGKPVKVDKSERKDFFQNGPPPVNNGSDESRDSAASSTSTGLIIGVIVVLVIVTVAAVCIYCFCRTEKSAKKGRVRTPGLSNSNKRSSANKIKRARKGGNSSSKGLSTSKAKQGSSKRSSARASTKASSFKPSTKGSAKSGKVSSRGGKVSTSKKAITSSKRASKKGLSSSKKADNLTRNVTKQQSKKNRAGLSSKRSSKRKMSSKKKQSIKASTTWYR